MTANLSLDKGDLILTSSYHRGLVEDLKRIVPYHDRQWIADKKVWRIKYMWGHDIADLCKKHLGQSITVPKQVTQTNPGPLVKLLKVEYIGATKERSDGSQTATGWTNGGWNIIIPAEILRNWFSDEAKPDEMPTYYAMLGCKSKATPEEIKKAYRLSARTWHPDVNKEPDAHEQFIRIQTAYETLSDPQQRRKYDAGLIFERDHKKDAQKRQERVIEKYGWRPPIRCGWITCEGVESLGRFAVSKILNWQDITDERGRSMISFWLPGQEIFSVEWI